MGWFWKGDNLFEYPNQTYALEAKATICLAKDLPAARIQMCTFNMLWNYQAY
jgi:hypothetical protein